MTVSIPESVKRQIDNGEKIHNEMYGNPDDKSAASNNDKPTESDVENPAAAAQDTKPVDWEHRFKQYKASTDQTINEGRVAVRDLTNKLSESQASVKVLTEQVSDLTKQVNELSDGESLDDDDLDPELKQIIEKQIEPMKKQVEEANQKATDLTEKQEKEFKQREDRYWSDVYTKISDENGVSQFESINDSAEFQAWLEDVDPRTGRVRNDDLQAAHNALDANTVIAIFNVWKASHKGSAQAESGEPDVNLTPDTSRNTETGSQDKRIWSSAEVNVFYKDKALGKYRDKPDQARAIESDIFAAQQEGRLRP